MGFPGKAWAVSSAWSETLTIKSSSLFWNSCHDLLRASDASIRYLSFRIFRVTGDTSPLGVTPALKASNFAAPNSFTKYSAKMLRLAFQVQRNRIENFPCMVPDSKVKVPKKLRMDPDWKVKFGIGATWRSLGTKRVEGWDGSRA